MAPRRQPRQNAATSTAAEDAGDTTSALSRVPALPTFPSKGTEVWGVSEIRSGILDQITDLKDLSSLMRVEKKGMALIAGKLYHTMKHKHLRAKMSISAPRRRMYENAVSVLDCTDLILTPTLIRKFGLNRDPMAVPRAPGEGSAGRLLDSDSDGGSDTGWKAPAALRRSIAAETKARVKSWLEEYQPELLAEILPGLRKQFPGLQKLVYGGARLPFDPRHYWAVELYRSAVPDPASHATVASGTIATSSAKIIGSVIFTRTLVFYPSLPPPAELLVLTPSPPSPAYGTQVRFDLELFPNGVSYYVHGWPERLKEWVIDIEKNPRYSNLYRSIDFGEISITLPIITSLYQRQIDAGHIDRLQVVIARHLASFDVAELQLLAGVAWASLRQLVLSISTSSGQQGFLPGQFAEVVGVVRDDLPNLVELEVWVQDHKAVDDYLRDKLTKDLLCRRGRLTSILVCSRGFATHSFLYLLRYISPLIAEKYSEVRIGLAGSEKDVTTHLAFIRSHPHESRRVLTMLDFSLLGIGTLDALLGLTFDNLGEPQHLLATRLEQYIEMEKPSGGTGSEIITKLESSRSEIIAVTRQLVVSSRQPMTITSTTDFLQLLQRQIAAVNSVAALTFKSQDLCATAIGTADNLKGSISRARIAMLAARAVVNTVESTI